MLLRWPTPRLPRFRAKYEGVHIDVLSLKRTEGNMLTLRAAFVNESGAPVKDSSFPGMNGSGWLPALIDYQNKRKYRSRRIRRWVVPLHDQLDLQRRFRTGQQNPVGQIQGAPKFGAQDYAPSG